MVKWDLQGVQSFLFLSSSAACDGIPGDFSQTDRIVKK